MKKIYLLFTLLMSLASVGQPIITMIADGDESGGTPEVLEIYAKGTVDFTQYSLQNQTNSNTSWGNTYDLSPLGTITDAFVYIYNNKQNANDPFAANFPSVTTNKLDVTGLNILNLNGDDRIRIIETASTTVIDTYGVDGEDGTGKTWEYKDGYSKRNNGTGPDAVFVPANWEFHNGALDGHGAVQDGTKYEDIIGIGTYTPSTSAVPSIAITSPADGRNYNPETTQVSVSLSVTNFNVAQPSNGDGYIIYEFDNDAPVNKYDTNDIVLTGLTPGVHLIKVQLVDNAGAPLNPPATAQAEFTIKSYTVVANLTELRAGTIGDYYSVTGEVFVIGGQQTNNGTLQAFLQDNSAPGNEPAGIMVFDKDHVVTISPNLYDGLTNVKGMLSEFKGVLQIFPTIDPSINSTGNAPIDPQVITTTELNDHGENYESELIKIENGTIQNPDTDANFVQNKNYNFDGPSGVATVLRVFFHDLAGQPIPNSSVDATGIAGEYNGTRQFYPRDINDIVAHAAAVSQNNIEGLNIYPNPVNDGNIYISSDNPIAKKVIIYSITGKQVFSREVENGQAISIRNLKTGLYLVKVIEDHKTAVQKLMVK